MATPRVTEVTASSFGSDVLGGDEPVIVEFFSHGCPHCQVFNPIFDKLSDTIGDRAKFVRLDVLLNEDNRKLAVGRGVRGVPTIEVFYRGRIIGSIVGNHPMDKMVESLDKFLEGKDEHFGEHTPIHKLLS